MLGESIKKHWEELALTDFNGDSFQYRDIARKVAKLHILFENSGIKKGDKVVVIAGHEKGKEGVVIASMPSKNMVVVEGLNKVTKHNKPNQQNKLQILHM